MTESWSYEGEPGEITLQELQSSDPVLNSGWFECPGCGAKIEQLALRDLLDKIDIDFSTWFSFCNPEGLLYLRKLAEAYNTSMQPLAQYNIPPAYLVGVSAMRFMQVTWHKIHERIQVPAHQLRGRYFSFMRYVGTYLSSDKEFLVDGWPAGVDLDSVLSRKTVHVDKYGQQATELLLSRNPQRTSG